MWFFPRKSTNFFSVSASASQPAFQLVSV